jgi:hypothetical protein
LTNTAYESHNAKFSNDAHAVARQAIYPYLFGAASDALSFEDTLLDGGDARCRILDGELGIDRIIRVNVPDLNAPLVYTIQERFRRPNPNHRQILTVTEWNWASGQPSELHKIAAMLFVYGYFDEDEQQFIDWVCVDVARLLLCLAHGDIEYERRRNKKDQTYLGFDIVDLRATHCVIAGKPLGAFA